MFIHNLKYAIKTMLRNKTALIWTLLFPIALGTFMYMAFGNLYEFNGIEVAVVKESENEAFEAVLEEFSKEGEDQLLKVTYMSDADAKAAIKAEEVASIIYINDELNLTIYENSYESTVVKSILDEYKKQEKVLTDIAINNPEALESAMEAITSQEKFFIEKITSDGNQDVYTNYFYAIFAMSCLFASFGAIEKISAIQANVSPLGMRRCLSPNSKATTIIAEFCSMLIAQVVIEIVALIYFTLIGVDFGTKYLEICGILVLGSCIGISLGVIIGSSTKLKDSAKTGISISISMVLSVLADLVASGVKDDIEHTVPIINRLNPAALIVDSFYALNIYDTYDRYFRNMATLGILTVVLLTISFLILRRNKYASV